MPDETNLEQGTTETNSTNNTYTSEAGNIKSLVNEIQAQMLGYDLSTGTNHTTQQFQQYYSSGPGTSSSNEQISGLRYVDLCTWDYAYDIRKVSGNVGDLILVPKVVFPDSGGVRVWHDYYELRIMNSKHKWQFIAQFKSNCRDIANTQGYQTETSHFTF